MSHLHIRVVEGRDLPAADPNGLSDPYVKVKLNGGGKHKSAVIEKTLNPEWNFDAGFELSKDSASHELLFEVWDEDKMSANDFLGQVKFNVGEIMQHKVVGGFFDLLNKDFSAKAGGDIYVIMCLGEELKDDQRKSYLNGIAAQLAMKNLKNKKK